MNSTVLELGSGVYTRMTIHEQKKYILKLNQVFIYMDPL